MEGPSLGLSSPGLWTPGLWALALLAAAGCTRADLDGATFSGEGLVTEGPALDELVAWAGAEAAAVGAASSHPDDWDQLALNRYTPDFQLSGEPGFEFLNVESIRADGDRIRFAALELTRRAGGSELVSMGDGRVLQLGGHSDAARDAVLARPAELATFGRPLSEYVGLGKAAIRAAEAEGDRPPPAVDDLILESLEFRYFRRPQQVELTFLYGPSVEVTRGGRGGSAFTVTLDPDGIVVPE